MNEKKRGRGVRYTPEQKQEVLDFVKANPGRGSMKQAQDKFGVSYVAIRNWLEDSGVVRPKRGRNKAKGEKSAAISDRADESRFERAKELIDSIRDAEAQLRGVYADLNGVLKP